MTDQNRLKVLQLGRSGPRSAAPIESLVSVPCDWTYVDSADDQKIISQLAGKDVFIGARFTPEMGAAADRLRLIALPAAGFEKIEPTAVPSGCTVANAYEHEAPIAEFVMMAAVLLDHEVLRADATLRRNDWSEWLARRPPHRELLDKTMGVIGLGHIGRRVLRLAKAYEMRCIAVSRTQPDPATVRELALDWAGAVDDLPALLGDSDFVVVATPLNDQTRGLIGGQELSAMKRSAYLINPARGPIVQEESLFRALRNRTIAGAAIDVWWQYPHGTDDSPPPSRFPFAELDNVLMTPHISGGTFGTGARRTRVVAENIERLARGEPLANVIAALSKA